MAFTPKILDGLAAGARFMKLTGVKRGTCLNAVWRAFGSPKSDGLNNGYPWASDALKAARANGALRTGTIAVAPPGSVLYWSNVMGVWNRGGRKVYGDAGHIGIKGHGGFWTIDATGSGSLDFVKNDALAKKWSWVKFEGYAYGPGAFLGHTVVADIPRPAPAAPADVTAAPITPPQPAPEEFDMSTIRYVHRAEPGYKPEWMIVGMEIPGGYQITLDETTAQGWGAIYGTDKGASWKALTRKQYVQLQASAKALNEAYVKQQRAIHG